MKKVMVIGAIEAGKTSLIRALLKDDKPALKTQALEFKDRIIDTPGEYSENPMYYRSLMATSLQARLLVLVQDSTKERCFFPPGFAQGFPIPAIGVITKIDHPRANIERAVQLLRQALPNGAIFRTSSVTGEGIEQLAEWLRDQSDPATN